MGTLEPLEENGLRYNICTNCGSEISTPKDLRYNKAKKAIKGKK